MGGASMVYIVLFRLSSQTVRFPLSLRCLQTKRHHHIIGAKETMKEASQNVQLADIPAMPIAVAPSASAMIGRRVVSQYIDLAIELASCDVCVCVCEVAHIMACSRRTKAALCGKQPALRSMFRGLVLAPKFTLRLDQWCLGKFER